VKHNIFIVGVLFISCTFFSNAQQDIISLGAESAFTKVGVESWASGGTGVVDQGASGAMFSNPACLDFQSLTVTGELSGRLATKIYGDWDYDGMFFPTSVYAGMKIDQWNLSAGYFNYLNYHTSISVSMDSDPSITREDNTKVHSYFASANHVSEKFSYGLTLALNNVTYNSVFGKFNRTNDGYGLLAVAGLLVAPSDKFQVGLSFNYASPIEFTESRSDLLVLIDNPNNDTIYAILEPIEDRAVFPWGFQLGLSGEVLPNMKLFTSIDFQNWKERSPDVKNLLNVHVGVVIDVFPYSNIRFGFFTQNDFVTFLGQNFVTGGFQTGNENFKISLTILDSHLFNGEEFQSFFSNKKSQFHQTIISLGGTYMIE